jgi:CheY-like chemotaxis protein
MDTPETSEPIEQIDPARLVVVADPDEARGKLSAEAVRSWGLIPHLVRDGVEAMLSIQRMLPSVVILDASLPKMFGFQVCEVVKRNDSLRHTRVVLVGAIHHQDRYRRAPADLYGADVYIEQPDLPEGLLPILRDVGMPIHEDAQAPVSPPTQPPGEAPTSKPVQALAEAPPIVSPPPPVAVAPPVAPELAPVSVQTPAPEPELGEPAPAAGEDPERAEERERALRLARIAVSEMVLYQPEKFEQAAKAGTLEQALDLEIQEARALLRQRISEEVRAETDFIIDELNRVAAERS